MAELRERIAAGDEALPPGAHRHGDEIHWEAHTHPHVAAADDGRPVIGIVGAVFSAIAYVVIRRLGSTEHHMVVVLYFPLVTGPASLPILALEGLGLLALRGGVLRRAVVEPGPP